MVYRLLAVNIDGTLLHSNGRLNKGTKEAIEYVQHKGVQVVLVTSRSYHSSKKVAKALKIEPKVVAHQGAYVTAGADQPIFVQRMAESLVQEIVQLLEKTSCQIQLVNEKQLLGNRMDLPGNLVGKSVKYMNEQSIYSQHYVDTLSEELEENPFAAAKIEVYFPEEAEKDTVYQLIQSMYPEDAAVLEKDSRRLTIVPAGVSKWNGVRYLADYLGIKPNEIVAIGDGRDDLEMIERSGFGVAMGNAPIEVKLAAEWVTRTNDEQGAAYMLKEFFRKQHPIGFLEKINHPH